jgi:8-oxo-dGTP diphosphatase
MSTEKKYKDVTAAILIKDGKVLIAQRVNDKHHGFWEFPGGKVDIGETPEEAIVRELKEELSIDTEVLSFFDESIYDYGAGKIRLLAYKVKWLSGELKNKVHGQLSWTSFSELLGYQLLPADIPLAKKLIEKFN